MIMPTRRETERDALMLLNALPGLTNRRIRDLLDVHVSPSKICSFNAKDWSCTGFFDQRQLARLIAFDRDAFLREEKRLLSRQDTRVITFWDPEYPDVLKHIPDAPLVLYVKGEMPLSETRGLAVVGSRRASIYGRVTAQKFAGQFAEMGLDVISGLAAGIDTAAHRGSLSAKGRTIAVLGSGLAWIYPAQNIKLAREIEKQGLLVSEFPMRTEPFYYNFPRRNRIISGLALGVLVVEAAKKSGALITASFALEQGKEVFAIPGQVDRPTAQGTHHLIRQGAKLVNNVQDILEELVLPLRASAPQTTDRGMEKCQESQEGSLRSKAVLDLIGEQPVHFEQLLKRSQIGFSRLLNVLLGLELRKSIKRMPGQIYVRV